MTYKPALGASIRITNLSTNTTYEGEVSGITGQYVFVGKSRFHSLDDRQREGVWKVQGLQFEEAEKANQEQVTQPTATLKAAKIERVKAVTVQTGKG